MKEMKEKKKWEKINILERQVVLVLGVTWGEVALVLGGDGEYITLFWG